MPLARGFQSAMTLPPASFFTGFPLTEDPLSEGGIWTTAVNFYKAPETTPGKCFANANTDSFDDALAQLTNPAMGDNYRVGVHAFRQGGYSPGVSHEIGLYLRLLIDNSNPGNTLVRGYECLFPYDSTAFQILAWLGVNHAFPDNFSILSPVAQNGGLANVQNGDLLEAQISGTSISIYQNSTLIYTLTDSTWTSGGGPGWGAYVNTGGTPANFCPTDFACQAL